MSAILFITSDLVFASRVLGAATALGLRCQLAAADAEIDAAGGCALALVDLAAPGLALEAAVAKLRAAAPACRIVAFGPHVDTQALQAAQAAGCDEVLSRSQFHKQYVELLQAAAREAT
jgi:DNA-binding NarL/FixJ family response regulator